jgi:hypothetical protein
LFVLFLIADSQNCLLLKVVDGIAEGIKTVANEGKVVLPGLIFSHQVPLVRVSASLLVLIIS